MPCNCGKSNKFKKHEVLKIKKINMSKVMLPKRRRVRSTQIGTTFDFVGTCGGTFLLARVHGLSVELNTIRNVGNCTFTLFGVDSSGNVLQNTEYTLPPGTVLARYTAGNVVHSVLFRCAFGQGGSCILRTSFC